MQFNDFSKKTAPVISFEVFPPRTEAGVAELRRRLPKLRDLNPDLITVTYGAFGTSRDRTLEIASLIKNELGVDAAHHLTCVGSTEADIDTLLKQISQSGIKNIVALRGDPPEGQDSFVSVDGGYLHASDLVGHIRSKGHFGIAVAGYPEKHCEALDFETDLRHLKHKVDMGADLILTQLFYDNRHYFQFVKRCREHGIDKPIVPGLLPILSLRQVQRITKMCGASLPEALVEELKEADGDEVRVHEVGIRHTIQQGSELLENGVPGLHFYVLNRYFHIAEVMKNIAPTLNRMRRRSGSR
jgi:methylenetetrahydrofolate reductase (NADPH)